MLKVQRELQESQVRQEDRMNQLTTTSERALATAEINSEAIATLERSISQLVTVATAHQDSMEQVKRTVDYLLAKDGGDR